jgi:two-component system sensor histidine kinase DesK
MTDSGGGTSARGPYAPRRGPGSGSKLRFLFTGVWLVYLIEPVSDLFGQHHTQLWTVGGLVIAAAFCVIYVCVIGTRDGGRPITKVGLAVVFGLAVLACVVYGKSWLSLWIYVSAATGFVFPGWKPATRAVFGLGCCFALLAWLTHGGMVSFLSDLLPVVLIGWAMAGFRMQATLVRELSQARETVAGLAASEERLRLARDMHDLTGQSLSMITLKSELVRKLLSRLPQSKERDAALREAGDISQVSRQTLHDIREAVSGYRRPTLAVETITARTALDAADIHLDDAPGLTLRSGSFDAEAEAVLAWCLREATTNVIRHSGAKNCRVRLTQRDGELSLEVSDDGRGLQSLAGQPGGNGQAGEDSGELEPGTLKPAGSGLRGMSERLTALGGRLSFGHGKASGGRGLRLVATVPEAPVRSADGDGAEGGGAGARGESNAAEGGGAAARGESNVAEGGGAGARGESNAAEGGEAAARGEPNGAGRSPITPPSSVPVRPE